MRIKYLVIAAAAILLAGCGLIGGSPNTSGDNPSLSAIQTAVVAALATPPAPAATAAPDAPAVPLPADAPTQAYAPFDATVSAETLNLRGGPSLLHNIISQYRKGDVVHLLGRAPGDEWVKAVGADNRTGWMAVTHLTLPVDVTTLPLLEINESLVARGQVVDANGNGIPGIQVALTRMGGADRVRIQGTSGQDGYFYAYAPVEYQGKWLAAVIGIGCTSPIVDANCRYGGVFYPLAGIDLVLPVFTDLIITYK
jgi:hypothetical protein